MRFRHQKNPGFDGRIHGVADTALWVASLRADESARPDAAFSDPLAKKLAGGRGAAITENLPHGALTAWGVILRTCAIDRLIQQALTEGIDTIINLGAGLDTRPYRMSLPSALRWIELDLPSIITQKQAELSTCSASCAIERIALDLKSASDRNAFLTTVARDTNNALVVTEGVLPYFSAADASSLAQDLSSFHAFRFWIQDFDNAGLRSMPKAWRKPLEKAPFLFNVKDWFHFFQQYGWEPAKIFTSGEEAIRLNRPYPASFPRSVLMRMLPRDVKEKILSVSGAVLLRNANLAGR